MRFALLLLGLAACSTDTFVAPDSGGDDGGQDDVASEPDVLPAEASADVGVADAIATEGSTADAGVSTKVSCGNSGTCDDQICCSGLNWGAPACQPASQEGKLGCGAWLECDDSTDCKNGQVCCATASFNGITNTNDVTHSACAAGCLTQGSFQLCTQQSECGGGSCKSYDGHPAWISTCQ